jgi:hypothetical protein
MKFQTMAFPPWEIPAESLPMTARPAGPIFGMFATTQRGTSVSKPCVCTSTSDDRPASRGPSLADIIFLPIDIITGDLGKK